MPEHFNNAEEAGKFWNSHSSADYWNEMEGEEMEFDIQKIPFRREVPLPIKYKGALLNKSYFADFILFNNIILELKALDALSGVHESQVLNYLKATDFRLGILVNFGQPKLQYKRLVN